MVCEQDLRFEMMQTRQVEMDDQALDRLNLGIFETEVAQRLKIHAQSDQMDSTQTRRRHNALHHVEMDWKLVQKCVMMEIQSAMMDVNQIVLLSLLALPEPVGDLLQKIYALSD